jgi:hypothetical protein
MRRGGGAVSGPIEIGLFGAQEESWVTRQRKRRIRKKEESGHFKDQKGRTKRKSCSWTEFSFCIFTTSSYHDRTSTMVRQYCHVPEK